MEYKIIISPRAQKEIEDAIDYYAIRSSDATGPRGSVDLIK